MKRGSLVVGLVLAAMVLLVCIVFLKSRPINSSANNTLPSIPTTVAKDAAPATVTTPSASGVNSRPSRELSFKSTEHAADKFKETATPGKLSAFDVRDKASADNSIKDGARAAAVRKMKERMPTVEIATDRVTGAPLGITVPGELLTGPQGRGRAMPDDAAVDATDRHGSLKAFLNEYSGLFGHGSEVLAQGMTNRDFVTAHNGLRTAAWQQQVDGIPITGAELRTHITKEGALANVLSGFIPEPEKAADQNPGRRKERVMNPAVSAAQAVSFASINIEEPMSVEMVGGPSEPPKGPTQKQSFPVYGDGPLDQARAELAWLPLSRTELSLCWKVGLFRHTDGNTYEMMVNADTGEIMARHATSMSLENASYKVFTGSSPAPYMPGPATPSTAQGTSVSATMETLSAIDTTASPLGWILDGQNISRGNNVDANFASGVLNYRVLGSSYRTFDYSFNFSEPPPNSAEAATVNAFYWCNWMHDKLYQLGFTEAAGNFQKDNIARGGLDNDPVVVIAQASVQENAVFFFSPDGASPTMQLFMFPGPAPDRDVALDAHVILHEYTHGLETRTLPGVSSLVGELPGMMEGWSDFYPLALLSRSTDDIEGNYPLGGYITHRLRNGLNQNYYYGIRRYPYTTDMAKGPLDYVDVNTAPSTPRHPNIPRSPVTVNNPNTADHMIGEVWANVLWEVRAALIKKHGFATGNQLALQLVTDGMRLISPTVINTGSQTIGLVSFVSGRDGILLADSINNGGANAGVLWAAFAKRGLGSGASSGSNANGISANASYNVPTTGSPLLAKLSISPGTISENGGTATATITLNRTHTSDLVFTITPRYGSVSAPSTVTLYSGNTTATFTVTGVNDSSGTGTRIEYVTVTESSTPSATARVDVQDDDVNHFAFGSISSQSAGQAFSVSVTAKNPQNSTAAGFSSATALSAWTADTSSKVVISSVAITNVATSATVDDTMIELQFVNVSGASLNLSDWQVFVYGGEWWPNFAAGSFQFPAGTTAAAGDTFRVLFQKSGSEQRNPYPYPTNIAAGYVKWNFPYPDNPIAVMLRNPQGVIADFMCAADADPSEISFPTAIPSSAWTGPAIPTHAGLTAFYRRIGSSDHNSKADWKVVSYTDPDVTLPGITLPFTTLRSVAISPTSSGSFSAGTWSGNVTLSEILQNVFLRVEDSAGHAGESGLFNVQAPAGDLSISIASSVNPAISTNMFNYALLVTNSGPSNATSVYVTNVAPSGSTIVSVTSSQGSCSTVGQVTTCSLGTIAANGTATVTINVRGTVGDLTDTATVIRGEADAYAGNNTASHAMKDVLPTIFADDATVTEGNSGTVTATVTLRLSGAHNASVSVNYATRDDLQDISSFRRNATAGSDYVATSGTATFAAGETTKTISITVNGDVLYEYISINGLPFNEQFLVDFTSPANAYLATPLAHVIIADDDAVPTLSVANISVNEPNSGTADATFVISLSAPAGRPLPVSVRTQTGFSWGTASENVDYEFNRLSAYIPPGVTAVNFVVKVRGDTVPEANETFTLFYSGFTGATCTIVDNDSSTFDHFDISSVASPQVSGVPFPVTITARTAGGGAHPGFTGNATLRAYRSSQLVTIGSGSDLRPYPLGTSFYEQRSQTIYLASEIARSGEIRALAFDVANLPGQTLNNFTVRMKHTTASSFSSASWDNSGWTTVFQGNIDVTALGWFTFNFDTPFNYNGTDNLLVDFSFDNSSYSFDGVVRSTATSGSNRSLILESDGAHSGAPTTWSGTSPAPTFSQRYSNTRFSFATTVSSTPISIGPFVSGVWSGQVTINEVASGVTLWVRDADNHVGTGNSFNTIQPLIITSPGWSSGSFQFTYSGGPGGQTVTIEASDDMIDWTTAATATLTGSSQTYTDSSASTRDKRFYRAKTPDQYAPQAVGFYRRTVPGQNSSGYGFEIVANQLDNPTDNTVATLFAGVPSGTVIKEMTTSGTFTDNTWNGTAWTTPSMTVPPGKGVFVSNPGTTPFTVTLHGFIPQGAVAHSAPAAYSIRAAAIPQVYDMVSMQYPPVDDDYVYPWDSVSQGYEDMIMYFSDYGWFDSSWGINPGNFNIGEGVVIYSTSAKSWSRNFSVWSQKLKAQSISSSSFGLRLAGGKVGATVDVERSSDLATWTSSQTVTIGSGEVVDFSDSVSSVNARFYRAKGPLGRAYTAIGFYRVTVPGRDGSGNGGYALLANQLDHPTDNKVSTLFAGVPNGTVVRKWVSNAFVDNTLTSGTWTDPFMTVNPGEGFFVRNPGTTPFTIDFMGTLRQGSSSFNLVAADWNLVSSAVPLSGSFDQWASPYFGYPAGELDGMDKWNVSTQDYNYFVFFSGSWSPSTPTLGIGEGVFIAPDANRTWKHYFSVW